MILEALVITVVMVGNVELLSLPSYITPCSLSDPEFEKCAISTGESFFKHIMTGDKDLKIPDLTRIEFPTVYVNNSKNVNFIINNCYVRGFNTAKFHSLKKIPGKNRIEINVSFLLYIMGDYDINCQIGDVTIAGSGPGNWTMNRLGINLAFEWQIKEIDGVGYTDVTKLDCTVDLKDDTLQLESDNNLNELLTKYGQDILNETRHRSVYYSKVVFTKFTRGLFSSVPYNEIFLE